MDLNSEQKSGLAADAAEREDEEWRAIEAGLASVDRGEEGVDLDEAIERLRRKYGIHHQP
ncbi:MAG: hypothetical protein K8T25_09095 [Planctomycetia bacterium]|nr:hypothetical protein [Planctomycetia bacterium]